MILVTAAMNTEIQQLIPGSSLPVSSREMGTLGECSDPGRGLTAAVIGTGKVMSAFRMGALLETYHPCLVVHIGICGSAHRSVQVGQVIVPAWCIQYDLSVEEFSLPSGRIPYTNIDRLGIAASSTGDLIDRLQRETAGVQVFQGGTLASGDRFLSCRQRDILAQHTEFRPLHGVDMESFSVALACKMKGVELVIMKVVSDDMFQRRPKRFSRFLSRWSDIFTRTVRSYSR